MQNSVKLEVYVHWTVRVENVTIGSKFFDIFRQQKNIDCVISFLIERSLFFLLCCDEENAVGRSVAKRAPLFGRNRLNKMLWRPARHLIPMRWWNILLFISADIYPSNSKVIEPNAGPIEDKHTSSNGLPLAYTTDDFTDVTKGSN